MFVRRKQLLAASALPVPVADAAPRHRKTGVLRGRHRLSQITSRRPSPPPTERALAPVVASKCEEKCISGSSVIGGGILSADKLLLSHHRSCRLPSTGTNN